MTGLWQIEARENTSFYAYRHLDLFYVDNWSPTLDLLVLVSTVPVVLARAVRSLLGRADLVAEVR
jgi:lipopolysaccharide/colanic/teichoic acid biosynthesis glycosyltransferase